MKIRDAYGRWHDTEVDPDFERSLWQTGNAHSGFYDPFHNFLEGSHQPNSALNDWRGGNSPMDSNPHDKFHKGF